MGTGSTAARYYLYRAILSVGFTAPIWYLYLAETTSFAAAGVLQAIWWVSLIVFEVPTGYLGDRIGWRRALLVGVVGRVVAYVVIALATGFTGLAVGFVLGGLFGTFRSGTADAWLYESLEAELGADTFSHVRGRGNAVMFLVSGVTAVAGGYLADATSKGALFALTAAVTVLAIPVVMTFPRLASDGDSANAPVDPDDEAVSPLEALRVVGQVVRAEEALRVVVGGGVVVGALWAVNFAVQPVLRGFGVPVASLGWFYGGFTVVGALVSYRTEWIRDRVGLRRWFHWVPVALGIGLVVLPLAPWLVFPVFFVGRGVRSLMNTFAGQYVNDRVGSVGRATVLSAVGMVFQLAGASAQAVAGWLGEALGYVRSLAVFGGVVLIVVVALAALQVVTTADEHESTA